MEGITNWLRIGIPSGWGDVLVRTVKVAVIAFVALMLKERLDDSWDAPACAVDAGWVAGGTLVLNTVLAWLRPRTRLQ
jgi:hypothetical protein